MVICPKKQKHCHHQELDAGDCWIGISLAQASGLILAAGVGKQPDELIEELVVSTEGKTACLEWDTDGWGGYERVLGAEVDRYIGKTLTQRNERTNGILRQQTGRWLSGTLRERRQNKFGKVWQPTKVTVRLVLSYFN